MKLNKTDILLILLILSIVFHGIITRPIESKYEFYRLEKDQLGIYDKENEKFYKQNPFTGKFDEVSLEEDNLINIEQ